MAIKGILDKHNNKTGDKASEKEIDAKAEAFRKELASNGQILMPDDVKKAADAVPKRGPGRPKGSTSQSPKRAQTPPAAKAAPEKQPDAAPGSVADALRRRPLINKLRAYRKHFPHLLDADLAAFNPHACSLQELEDVLASCRRVVQDDVQADMAPNMLGQMMKSAEDELVSYGAVSSNAAVQQLAYLRGFTEAAHQDPALATDLKIIAIEASGFMPTNPYFRFGLNLLTVAAGVVRYNKDMASRNTKAQAPQFNDL